MVSQSVFVCRFYLCFWMLRHLPVHQVAPNRMTHQRLTSSQLQVDRFGQAICEAFIADRRRKLIWTFLVGNGVTNCCENWVPSSSQGTVCTILQNMYILYIRYIVRQLLKSVLFYDFNFPPTRLYLPGFCIIAFQNCLSFNRSYHPTRLKRHGLLFSRIRDPFGKSAIAT